MYLSRFLLFTAIACIVLTTFAYARVLTPEVIYGIPNTTVGQRLIYFGEDKSWPIGGYGAKSASSGGTSGNYGAKGTTSTTSNIAWNDFIARGRDPTHISNSDPRIRGYTIRDVVVDLEPVREDWVFQNEFITRSKGTARIISDYDEVKGADPPRTKVMLRVRDLPPLEKDQIYQAWLVDEDTGYPLSIGMFRAPMVGISELNFEASMSALIYDMLVVTVEPFPDTDLHPGTPVLVGKIPTDRITGRDVSNLPFRSQWLE